MVCPNCGGPMRLEPARDFLTCDYCRSLHFPDPNADGVRVLGEPSEQQCPYCATPLTHASVAGRRLLYCERCRGLLVNMDVFMAVTEELRSRHPSSAYVGEQPDWSNLERKTLCPQCGRIMNTHGYAGPGNVIIDSCSECRVIWLDHGELQRIFRAPDRRYAKPTALDESPESSTESAKPATWRKR